MPKFSITPFIRGFGPGKLVDLPKTIPESSFDLVSSLAKVTIPLILSFTTTGVNNTITPGITTSAGLADWDLDDGNTISASNGFSHTYTDSEASHLVEITGGIAGVDILTMDLSSDEVSDVDLSALTEITNFVALNGLFTSLDLSANTKLTAINLFACQSLSTLDLSNNVLLTNINCKSCALTAGEVDQIIIDVDDSGVSTGARLLKLENGNAPRTAASDAAIASLVTKGWTVTTTP